MMDILSEAIMEELLDEHEATSEEREMVRTAVLRTRNPWDTVPLLEIFRMALNKTG